MYKPRPIKRLLALMLLLVIFLSLTGCSNQLPTVETETKITEFTKPAVVRVVSFNSVTYVLDSALSKYLGVPSEVPYYDGGMGSGAILSENGYIVTNAHVVETSKLEEKDAKQRLDDLFLNDLKEQLLKKDRYYAADIYSFAKSTTKRSNFQKVSKVIMPGGDSFTFDIKSYGAPLGQGKDVAIIKIDAMNLPIIQIEESDASQTSDKVTIAGYPGKADLEGFLDDKSVLVSTYSTGSIAARKTTDKGPVLQLSANVNPGNSGGPVISKEGKLVGIATATSSDGIGWAIPSSTVLEFARQAGGPVNKPGAVTQRWQEGLQLYWQNYYKKAIPKFEEVQRLYPKHNAISDYISKSQRGIESGKDRKDLKDYWLWIAGSAVVVIGLGGVLIILRKKKNSVPPTPPLTELAVPQASKLSDEPNSGRPPENAEK
ncbi:S1C family serine protease [Desulfosporosinus sp. Sb-LF]|uniref:S1C family serine protease n=1 Tax=Desulfosporosinus sp. Sb-LF TaxID=2560027 RepID=UPI00107F55E6|nr:S1C family serine protease [Desulfosporosinus sp. Sb-LF]TGE33274.1 trypsin-like serine protease [Desulfosporosinus sp. Sb-LF]